MKAIGIISLAILSAVYAGKVSAKRASTFIGSAPFPSLRASMPAQQWDSAVTVLGDGKTITITVSYAAIACGCPQWFETKYKKVKFLEGVERFYLEPTKSNLKNASRLWDGGNLSLTLRVTGRFSQESALPITYHTKGRPEKARIFWYDKMLVLKHQKTPID
jgi:hypothetical protein